MNNIPSITDAEWEIMKIVWKNNTITAKEIVDEIDSNFHWQPNTVKTLINRLLKKNVIAFNKAGKEYSYYSNITEQDCIKEKNQSFLKKVYNGSISSMVMNFVKPEKLTDQEIVVLKHLLNKSQE